MTTNVNLKTRTNAVRSGPVISRYVKKNVLLAMVFAVLGLWMLQVLFSYLAELEDFSDGYTYIDALTYIGYKSPYFLEQFIPTGALLGAVIGLGLLASQAELIVMRAAGISIYRVVWWALQPAVLFVLLALGINQYVLPKSNLLANQVRQPDAQLLEAVNGYWTLQKTTNTESNKELNSEIIFIDYVDAKGNIGEVKRWQLDANNRLTQVSSAQGGKYLTDSDNPDFEISSQGQSDTGAVHKVKTGDSQAQMSDSLSAESITSSSIQSSTPLLTKYYWQLNNIATLKLADPLSLITADSTGKGANAVTDASPIVLTNQPLAVKQVKDNDVIALPISPSSIYLLTRRAEDLSLTELYDHKRFNSSQGTRSLAHELAFWQKLLSPFAILSLVIVACSFVFGSLRTHSLGLRIVVALIFGLLFTYLQDLVGFVSLATGASPFLTTLLPIIGSALLGIYLIKRQS